MVEQRIVREQRVDRVLHRFRNIVFIIAENFCRKQASRACQNCKYKNDDYVKQRFFVKRFLFRGFRHGNGFGAFRRDGGRNLVCGSFCRNFFLRRADGRNFFGNLGRRSLFGSDTGRRSLLGDFDRCCLFGRRSGNNGFSRLGRLLRVHGRAAFRTKRRVVNKILAAVCAFHNLPS